jgi:hypothetical protein
MMFMVRAQVIPGSMMFAVRACDTRFNDVCSSRRDTRFNDVCGPRR